MAEFSIPNLSFVVLIGPSGSGKSTFARKHFLPTEVLSSDYCRGLVSDDENSQAATKDAFEVLHYIAGNSGAASMRVVFAAIVVALLFTTVSAAQTVAIDFDTRRFDPLPYEEDRILFSNPPGYPAMGSAGTVVSYSGRLTAGTNNTPIRIRASASQPFDLLSLEVDQLFRDWRVVSSSGAVFDPLTVGAVDFSGVPGWTGISYFDLLHDPPEANGSIRVDRVVIRYVPEPASLALAMVALIAARAGPMRE